MGSEEYNGDIGVFRVQKGHRGSEEYNRYSGLVESTIDIRVVEITIETLGVECTIGTLGFCRVQ